MKIKKAKTDIKLYKSFTGTNRSAESPIQGTSWGSLKPGKVLEADAFSTRSRICVPGVHASKTVRDSQLAYGNIVWEVIIPKGTRYYESTIKQARQMFAVKCEFGQFRAERVKLVRRVSKKRES